MTNPATCKPQTHAADPAPPNRRWQIAVLLLPLLLYAAALNPFFPPGSYDEVLYYTGAASLAEEGAFKFRDLHISDWPPGFPALMAVPFYLAGPSVWVAKTCVLACAGVGLVLAFHLFQKERREFPLLTMVLFGLSSFGFSMGTRILSEWPYFLASMLFFLALLRARDSKNPIRDGAIAGLCLGIAALTKFTGVVLGAAIIAQAVWKWRAAPDRRLRALAPEVITTVIGAGCFLAWKAKVHWQIAAGTAAPYEYYKSGLTPEHFGWFAPLSVPEKISDLFFRSGAILESFGWHGWLAHLAFALPAMLVFIGLAIRLTSKDRAPSDWYVLTLLILFASFADNKQTRYLMPVAPFLVHYALLGAQRVGQWLNFSGRRAAWTARGAVATWMLLSIGLAGQLLFAGNPAGHYRGLCMLASSTPETFYRGSWLELYDACQKVRNDPTPGSIAVIGGEDKYVTHFTHRHWIDFSPTAEFAFLLVMNSPDLPRDESARLNLECVSRAESIVLYKRNQTAVAQPRTVAGPEITGATTLSHDNN